MAYDIIVGRTESDRKKFGEQGAVLIGKGYVKMGRTTSLSNRIFLDVVRSHVILVCGKRGCLTEDTLIFTDKGYKKIKDFSEKEDEVYSYSKEENKFEWEKAELLRYPINNESLIKFKLEDGQSIVTTIEHPLLINNGDKIRWKKAKDITTKNSILSLPIKKIGKYTSNDIFQQKIKSISKVDGIKNVYDLAVPKNHSFIANGVISHNSGKSYTLGTIAEGICNLPEEVAKNIAIVIFDTMGIFWTMKYPNEKDEDLLKQWGLKPEGLNKVDIYVPEGYFKTYKEEGIPADYSFAVKPSELTPEDWRLTFSLDENNPLAIAIEKVIFEFQEKGVIDYSIDDITQAIDRDADVDIDTKNAAKNRFKAAKGWGLFQKEGTKISDMIQGGKISVLDLSAYTTGPGGWGVKNLVTGLIAKKLFIERTLERKKEEIETIKAGYSYIGSEEEYKKSKKPMVWLVIDEAHEFLPEEGRTAATEALITILREGRQPGVSTILATQQPGKIHRDVMTQTDLIISHRVTARPDVDALNAMMQSYMTSTLIAHLNNLPRESGAAVILDDNSERIYPMRVRPRFTWHGGEAPTAITYKKKLDLGI